MKDDIIVLYKCLLSKDSHIRSHNVIIDNNCGWTEEHVIVTMFNDGREIESSFSIHMALGILTLTEQNMKLNYYQANYINFDMEYK